MSTLTRSSTSFLGLPAINLTQVRDLFGAMGEEINKCACATIILIDNFNEK